MTQPFSQSLPAVPLPRGAMVFDSARAEPGVPALSVWRHFMSGRLAEFDYHADDREPFYGKVVSMDLGPVRINHVDCSAGRWSRLPCHLADGRDGYNLCMTIDSGYRLTQGQADIIRGPGEFVVIDKARASECVVERSGADCQILLPREAINGKRRGRDITLDTQLDSNGAPLRLLKAYVRSIFLAHEDLADPVVSHKVGDHLLDLAVLGLQPTRDAAEQAANRGLKAARLGAVLAEINKRYCDPAISPLAVAAAVNISPRYLYQLMEERGLVFGKLVLDLRLKRAFNLLSDPRHDHLRIGQIAYDCGFNDLSYFNRCFRAQFGDTPGAMRVGGVRERSVAGMSNAGAVPLLAIA